MDFFGNIILDVDLFCSSHLMYLMLIIVVYSSCRTFEIKYVVIMSFLSSYLDHCRIDLFENVVFEISKKSGLKCGSNILV